jgi:hypothetical protein
MGKELTRGTDTHSAKFNAKVTHCACVRSNRTGREETRVKNNQPWMGETYVGHPE